MIGRAVRSAVEGERTVAVAFSGGLDSSILARCVKDHSRVVACTAYLEGAGDASRARRAADLLGVDLVVTELNAENVRRELGAIDLPFEPSLMDRSLWCLYSLVSRTAKDSGARVMLLGQMADELFGGYAKYAEALRKEGEARAKEMMDSDAAEYASRGRVRDVGACGKRVEPRFPFEAGEVREFASALPVSFKIRDGVRKAVLRKAALELGVPEELAGAAKKAAQYSSGVQKLVAGSGF